MSGVSYHGTFFGEGLERVPGYEPSGLDVVLVEQLEKPPYAHGTSKEAWSTD